MDLKGNIFVHYINNILNYCINNNIPIINFINIRPHDMVPLDNMKEDFSKCLSNNVGFKGFGLKPESL